MSEDRPLVLTIAGHDPTAGAGLTADLKTFEMLEVYGMSVCTAVTIQNEHSFVRAGWLSEREILDQLDILFSNYSFSAVKVGLVKDASTLKTIVAYLKSRNPHTKIVVDPILKASAGFQFQRAEAASGFSQGLSGIDLLTPNREEVIPLSGCADVQEAATQLSRQFPVLLKGGHDPVQTGRDLLYENGVPIAVFKPQKQVKSGKHGSGCVLSAAIAAYLARGHELAEACRQAKVYIEQFLDSNEGALGHHNHGKH